jgi:acyl dehydratase
MLPERTKVVKPCYFEDFAVGDRIESKGLTATESAIIDFAMHFDPQPFHMDIEEAKSSLYGGLIASGIYTVAVTFRLFLATGVLAANMGSPGFDELRWLMPVRPGDTLHVVADVIEIRPSSSKPDRGVVRFKVSTLNQHNKTVQTVICSQLLKRRPAA